MKKDGKYMAADYEAGTEIKMLDHNGERYIKISDIIKWLKDNKKEAADIETEWLIKVFVKLKNTK